MDSSLVGGRRLDDMTVTVLGCGTCIPAAGRSAPGYLLGIGGSPVLVDPGPGSLARLAAAGVSYMDLGTVLVSHLHPDHTLDLVTLLQANAATPGVQRTLPLSVVGCRGLSQFLSRLLDIYDGIQPESYAMDVREMGAESADLLPGCRMRAGLSGHTSTSLSFRLERAGRVLVYSGDASARGGLAALARGADLLLCECSLPDGWSVEDHLTAGQVGEIAREAGVRRVALTHRYPPSRDEEVVSQVRRRFDGAVVLACDGWTEAV